MKIEFSQSDLQYLAVLIAEHICTLQDEKTKEEVVRSNSERLIMDFPMSQRLKNALQRNDLEHWSLEDIACFRRREWMRMPSFGKKTFDEFESIILGAGLTWGRQLFRRDPQTWKIVVKKYSV